MIEALQFRVVQKSHFPLVSGIVRDLILDSPPLFFCLVCGSVLSLTRQLGKTTDQCQESDTSTVNRATVSSLLRQKSLGKTCN